ncbi:MAG: hypothetical protein K6E89_00075 [Sphaerochaetaceae bacterium]|nr:hypothetical protein [Sphaerochaetaceae bacterium]
MVSLYESPDNQVHVHNSFTGDRKRFSLTSLKYRKEDKWANYVKGILLQLVEHGVELKPFSLELDGSILKCDGATLSAAVSVGVCIALKTNLKLDISDKDIFLMCYRNCTGYCGELTKYSTVVAMLGAEEGKYILFDMNTMSYVFLDDPFNNGICAMLMVDCKIPPTAMREEISLRHGQVREAFDKLKESYPYSLKEFPLTDLTDRVIPLDEESRRICSAVIEDKLAAAGMLRMFPAHDYAQIGRNLTKVGKLIRDDLEISCPEIDWLIKRSSEIPGCHGATIVFNGDNTYVALLINTDAIHLYDSRLEDYERIFGFKAKISPLRPGGKWEMVPVR